MLRLRETALTEGKVSRPLSSRRGGGENYFFTASLKCTVEKQAEQDIEESINCIIGKVCWANLGEQF